VRADEPNAGLAGLQLAEDRFLDSVIHRLESAARSRHL
jgi:hypothetical protein